MSYDHIQERFSEFSFLRGFINPVESFCVTLSIIYLHKNRGTEKPLVYTANNYLTQRYIEREDLEDIFNFLDTVDTETLKGYIKNEICVRHSQTILFQTNTQQISIH